MKNSSKAHFTLAISAVLFQPVLLLSLTCPSFAQETSKESAKAAQDAAKAKVEEERAEANAAKLKAKEAAAAAKIKAAEEKAKERAAAEEAKLKEEEEKRASHNHHSPAPTPPSPTPPAPTPPSPTPPSPTPPAPTPPSPVSKIPPGTPQWPIGSGCYLFPNSVFNAPITNLPVDPNSDTYINSIGVNSGMHPDFGNVYNGTMNGVYINIAGPDQAEVPITYTTYASESDPGPAPIPSNSVIEGAPIPSGLGPPTPDKGAGDAHLLVLQPSSNILWEFWLGAYSGGKWSAANGAMWNVSSNQMRPLTWTSADAAGLQLSVTSLKYEEAVSGSINHALRLTVSNTQNKFVWPASHEAGIANSALPPMGERLRLKAAYNTNLMPGTSTPWSAINRAIVNALATYGCIIADNNGPGAPFFLEGCYNENWNNDDLHLLLNLKASMFECVDETSLIVSPTSYEAATSSTNSVGSGADNSSGGSGGGTSGIQIESHHSNSIPRKN